MLDNSIDGVIEETFSTVLSDLGKETTVELKPGGKNIPVTDQNKVRAMHLFLLRSQVCSL
jgi:DNA gyrase/topoisomerase IV subunit B